MHEYIRKMTLQDYPCMRQLWMDCHLTEEPEDCLDDVARLLASPQSAGFIAQRGECIEGAVLCGDDGRYGYIHHLAVATASRRQGVGKLLVQTCLEFLQRKHVVVMVRESNELGREFWKHLDFQPVNGLGIQCRRIIA